MTKLTKEQIRRLKKGDTVYLDAKYLPYTDRSDIHGLVEKTVDYISTWQNGGGVKFAGGTFGYSLDDLERIGIHAELLSISDKHYC